MEVCVYDDGNIARLESSILSSGKSSLSVRSRWGGWELLKPSSEPLSIESKQLCLPRLHVSDLRQAKLSTGDLDILSNVFLALALLCHLLHSHMRVHVPSWRCSRTNFTSRKTICSLATTTRVQYSERICLCGSKLLNRFLGFWGPIRTDLLELQAPVMTAIRKSLSPLETSRLISARSKRGKSWTKNISPSPLI